MGRNKAAPTYYVDWKLKILYRGPLHEGQASPRLSVACLPLAASAAMP